MIIVKPFPLREKTYTPRKRFRSNRYTRALLDAIRIVKREGRPPTLEILADKIKDILGEQVKARDVKTWVEWLECWGKL